MQQTAEIIDLSSYRKARQAEKGHGAQPAMMTMPFAWVPVWVMVPVPVLASGAAV